MLKKLLDPQRPASEKLLIAALVLTLTIGIGSGYFFGNRAGTGKSVDTHDHKTATAQSGPQLWTCGMHPWIITEEPGLCPICNMELTPKLADDSADESSQGKERKIIYWRAPMDANEIYEQPGKSKMGMDLVPVYEDELVGGVSVKIDPVTQQNMGLRTALVEQGPLIHSIRTYGHITFDETGTAQVSPKFNGWVEKVYVDFTGQFVKKGDKLFDIYSPELLTAQEEYLVAFQNISKIQGNTAVDLLESARRRLLNWDVPKDQIQEIEKTGKVHKNLTIRSPFSGVVTFFNAQEGTFVKAGVMLYKISDLKRVWVEAHIYEYELPWVEVGLETEMTLPYLPGKIYKGKVSYIYPYLQKKTRDVVLRLEFKNPDYFLKPDMYADVKIMTTPKGAGLIIPAESVIRSGERNVVFVTRGDGKFTPRDVTLGLTLDNGKLQILNGLAPNETVVTSGQFLIDSESKLKEAVQKMLEAKKTKAAKKPLPDGDDFFNDTDQKKPAPAGKEDDFFKDM